MVLAVADQHGSIGFHKDPMRTREPGLERIPVRTVSALTRPQHALNHARLRIDPTDRVILGVDQIHPSVRRHRNSLGPGERRQRRRTVVTGEALLACARHVENSGSRPIQSQHLISLARDQPQIARRIEIQRTRSIQRRSGQRGVRRRRSRLARSGIGRDDAGAIDPANHMIADVHDVQIAARTKLNADRLTEGRRRRRSTIAAVSLLPRPSDRGDHPRPDIQFAHGVIAGVGNVQLTIRTKPDFVRLIQLGLCSRPTVTGVPSLACASDRGQGSIRGNPADQMSRIITKPQRAIRTPHYAERILQLGRARRSAIARGSRNPSPRDRRDFSAGLGRADRL